MARNEQGFIVLNRKSEKSAMPTKYTMMQFDCTANMVGKIHATNPFKPKSWQNKVWKHGYRGRTVSNNHLFEHRGVKMLDDIESVIIVEKAFLIDYNTDSKQRVFYVTHGPIMNQNDLYKTIVAMANRYIDKYKGYMVQQDFSGCVLHVDCRALIRTRKGEFRSASSTLTDILQELGLSLLHDNEGEFAIREL